MKRDSLKLLAALTLCVLAALAVAPRTARAENELAVRFSTQFMGASSGAGGFFATGQSSNVYQGEFSYAHSVVPIGRGALWAEGSWTVGRRDEQQLFGQFRNSLLLQQLTAGARYALPIFSWLVPQVRAGVGLLLGDEDLQNGAAGDASAWSAAFTSYALAGVELLVPRGPSSRRGKTAFTVGFIIEGGGVFSSRLAWSLKPDQSGDVLKIPLGGVDLGSLSLTGPVVRAGVMARF